MKIAEHAFRKTQLGDTGGQHIPLVPLPRIERQRFDGANAVDRLDQKRAALGFGALRPLGPAPVGRQHRTIQSTMRPHDASTTKVMIGLKKNMIGRKTSNVVESNTVPNNWPMRKVRIFHIWFTSCANLARLRSLEKIHRQVQDLIEHVSR